MGTGSKYEMVLYCGGELIEEIQNMTDMNSLFHEVNIAADMVKRYYPKRILKSGNRTIVFWTDGTKTIVKRAEGEEDNEYTAFCCALAKKLFNSNSQVKKMIKQRTEYQEKKAK